MTFGSQAADIYAPGMGQSAQIDELFLALQRKIKEELRFQQQLFELLVRRVPAAPPLIRAQGSLDVLLASNTASRA